VQPCDVTSLLYCRLAAERQLTASHSWPRCNVRHRAECTECRLHSDKRALLHWPILFQFKFCCLCLASCIVCILTGCLISVNSVQLCDDVNGAQSTAGQNAIDNMHAAATPVFLGRMCYLPARWVRLRVSSRSVYVFLQPRTSCNIIIGVLFFYACYGGRQRTGI